MYWGTFGQLRGMELARDMVTPASPEHVIEGLTGFFEAPWIMKRKGAYYMLYAGNNAGPDSPCTPAVYHACQAYGTAPSPLGPWTWRSEEHTSELQSLMRISSAVFCLKKKTNNTK